jgi:hypothetical protein
MKLRLLLTPKCDRNCAGCCNKDWNLKELPKVGSFSGYTEILLTGGEPMLFPDLVYSVVSKIRMQNGTAKIYLYTARLSAPLKLLLLMDVLDGVTITLHEQKDAVAFDRFDKLLTEFFPDYMLTKSLRLNVFQEVTMTMNILMKTYSPWIVKDNIVWIKNLHLPEGEVFVRLCATPDTTTARSTFPNWRW